MDKILNDFPDNRITKDDVQIHEPLFGLLENLETHGYLSIAKHIPQVGWTLSEPSVFSNQSDKGRHSLLMEWGIINYVFIPSTHVKFDDKEQSEIPKQVNKMVGEDGKTKYKIVTLDNAEIVF